MPVRNGFPFHALDTYLPKLVRAGRRVAICDQLEDPKLTKKLVKRGVTELVTPGVSYSDTTLQQKENRTALQKHTAYKRTGLDMETAYAAIRKGNSTLANKPTIDTGLPAALRIKRR